MKREQETKNTQIIEFDENMTMTDRGLNLIKETEEAFIKLELLNKREEFAEAFSKGIQCIITFFFLVYILSRLLFMIGYAKTPNVNYHYSYVYNVFDIGEDGPTYKYCGYINSDKLAIWWSKVEYELMNKTLWHHEVIDKIGIIKYYDRVMVVGFLFLMYLRLKHGNRNRNENSEPRESFSLDRAISNAWHSKWKGSVVIIILFAFGIFFYIPYVCSFIAKVIGDIIYLINVDWYNKIYELINELWRGFSGFFL